MCQGRVTDRITIEAQKHRDHREIFEKYPGTELLSLK